MNISTALKVVSLEHKSFPRKSLEALLVEVTKVLLAKGETSVWKVYKEKDNTFTNVCKGKFNLSFNSEKSLSRKTIDCERTFFYPVKQDEKTVLKAVEALENFISSREVRENDYIEVMALTKNSNKLKRLNQFLRCPCCRKSFRAPQMRGDIYTITGRCTCNRELTIVYRIDKDTGKISAEVK